MPLRLAPCDLGDPGWGDPWFPHGDLLLHSPSGMAWWLGCVSLFSAAIPLRDVLMLSPLALINP